MLVYWQALEKCRLSNQQNGLEIGTPFPAGPPSRPVSQDDNPLFINSIRRRLIYPLRVAALPHCDILHLLDHSDSFLLRFLQQKPRPSIVVTVHDLFPLWDGLGQERIWMERMRRRLRWMRQADLILAVSEFTARDVEDRMEIPRERIRVLPQGVDPSDFSGGKCSVPPALKHLAGERFILNVGSNINRKNLNILPEILGLLGENHLEIKLVRSGEYLTDPQKQQFEEMGVGGRLIELGQVDQSQQVWLYRNALACLVPSTLEGFGLPVLEAMAAGCPVVCSSSSSLPEAGGEAALYFNPQKPEEAAAHLGKIFRETRFRDELILAGRQRAASLTWQRHFSELKNIYHSLYRAA